MSDQERLKIKRDGILKGLIESAERIISKPE